MSRSALCESVFGLYISVLPPSSSRSVIACSRLRASFGSRLIEHSRILVSRNEDCSRAGAIVQLVPRLLVGCPKGSNTFAKRALLAFQAL